MLQAPEHIDRSAPESPYCPPAPKPQARPLQPLALLRTLKRNPLECWAAPHFEQPIVAGGLPIGHVLLVHEPGAIRRVLLDNAANYRKDRLQRRVLSAGLSDGLLSAEGEQWRIQRRVIAPMFARRTVMDFAPAMMAAARALIDRWSALGDRATIDVAAEMAKVTLDVVERTIFSDGFGSDAEDIRTRHGDVFQYDRENQPARHSRRARLRPAARPAPGTLDAQIFRGGSRPGHLGPPPDSGRTARSGAQRPADPSAGGPRHQHRNRVSPKPRCDRTS